MIISSEIVMNIRPIRNDDDLTIALARMSELWGAPDGTPEGDELDVLAVLIEAYETEHHAMPPGDPIQVIRYKMGELGLTQRQLAEKMGWASTGRLSELLSSKRELTTRHVRDLATALGIPAGLLLGDAGGRAAAAATEGGLELPHELLAEIRQGAQECGMPLDAFLRSLIDLHRQFIAQVTASPARRAASTVAANNSKHLCRAA